MKNSDLLLVGGAIAGYLVYKQISGTGQTVLTDIENWLAGLNSGSSSGGWTSPPANNQPSGGGGFTNTPPYNNVPGVGPNGPIQVGPVQSTTQLGTAVMPTVTAVVTTKSASTNPVPITTMPVPNLGVSMVGVTQSYIPTPAPTATTTISHGVITSNTPVGTSGAYTSTAYAPNLTQAQAQAVVISQSHPGQQVVIPQSAPVPQSTIALSLANPNVGYLSNANGQIIATN
jgi:hypothetical protein